MLIRITERGHLVDTISGFGTEDEAQRALGDLVKSVVAGETQ